MTNIIGAVVLIIFTIVAFALLFALPTMWLWNWLMPTIFAVEKITFLQALGLNFLSGILFKSHTSPLVPRDE